MLICRNMDLMEIIHIPNQIKGIHNQIKDFHNRIKFTLLPSQDFHNKDFNNKDILLQIKAIHHRLI